MELALAILCAGMDLHLIYPERACLSERNEGGEGGLPNASLRGGRRPTRQSRRAVVMLEAMMDGRSIRGGGGISPFCKGRLRGI